MLGTRGGRAQRVDTPPVPQLRGADLPTSGRASPGRVRTEKHDPAGINGLRIPALSSTASSTDRSRSQTSAVADPARDSGNASRHSRYWSAVPGPGLAGLPAAPPVTRLPLRVRQRHDYSTPLRNGPMTGGSVPGRSRRLATAGSGQQRTGSTAGHPKDRSGAEDSRSRLTAAGNRARGTRSKALAKWWGVPSPALHNRPLRGRRHQSLRRHPSPPLPRRLNDRRAPRTARNRSRAPAPARRAEPGRSPPRRTAPRSGREQRTPPRAGSPAARSWSRRAP